MSRRKSNGLAGQPKSKRRRERNGKLKSRKGKDRN
jgi:hypothetical protein